MADHDKKCERLVLTAASHTCSCWHRARIAELEAQLAAKVALPSATGTTTMEGVPDVVYLQTGGYDPETKFDDLDVEETTWSKHPIENGDTKYIRADLAAAPQQGQYDAVADAVQEVADAAQEAFRKAGIEPGEWDSDDIVRDVARGISADIERLAPQQGKGVWNWINNACEVLRRSAHAIGVPGSTLGLDIDTLLSGVPCPQEDLGFNSPADRAARAAGAPRVEAEAHPAEELGPCACDMIGKCRYLNGSPACAYGTSAPSMKPGQGK